MIERDPRNDETETDHGQTGLPKSNDTSNARARSVLIARKIIDEIVPSIGEFWNTNVCLVTKVVDGNYQLSLTGEVNRDAESLAFEVVKAELVQRGLVVTIDYIEYNAGLHLQRCRTGYASNVVRDVDDRAHGSPSSPDFK